MVMSPHGDASHTALRRRFRTHVGTGPGAYRRAFRRRLGARLAREVTNAGTCSHSRGLRVSYRVGMNDVFEGRLLIGATGSAAVAALPMYIGALRSVLRGPITVLMTHTATTFLPAHTVGLFADRVVTGQDPTAWPRENHATLASEHDLTVILPATAHTLSTIASGAAPNMLATTVLAATHPVAFFPVMTGEMWGKPAVQRNVATLREDGHQVFDPASGPRYDVATGDFVDSPQPPPPPRFIEIVRGLMTDGTVNA